MIGADEAAPLEAAEVNILDTAEAGQAAVRGSALRTAGYVLGLGLSLVSAPLLLRHLGTVRFGHYFIVITLVTIVASLTEGGLNSIALREYAANAGPRRTMTMRDLIGIRIVLSLVGGLLAVALAAAFGYEDVLVLGTAVAVAGQMLQVFQTLLGTSLQGELRFGWVTALELVRQLVSVVLIVVFVLAGAGVFPFFLIPAAAGLATLSLTIQVTRRLMPLRPAFHPSRWLPLLRDTLPFAAAIAVSVLYFRVAVLAMSLLASSKQTGYFSASFRVIEVLVGVPSLIAAAALPILARAIAQHDERRLRYAAGRLLEITLLLGTSLSLCLLLAAKPVIDVLGGHQYAASIPVLRIQGVALIGTCVAAAAGYVLLALREHRAILFANAAALVVSVALSAALIPPLHAEGGAIAVVIAEFTLAGMMAARLLKVRPQLRDALLRRPLAILAMGGISAAVALIPLPSSLLNLALGVLIFAGLLVVSGYLPPELGEMLRHRRRSLLE